MSALANMMYLFADELPRLGGGGFAGLFVGTGSIQRFLLGHIGVLLRMFGEGRTQLYFRALEYTAAGSAQAFAGAVDFEIEHRHRGAERRGFTPMAGFGGPL